MGYDSEFSAPVILDLETVGRDDAAEILGEIRVSRAIKDLAKIETARAEKKADLIEHAGLDPDLNRIVALGMMGTDGLVSVRACHDDSDELVALTTFWKRVITPQGQVRPLITFNGHNFDLIVVQKRSRMLGLRYPKLNLKKYGNPHPDLMWLLSVEGRLPFRSLAFYERLYKLEVEPNPLLDDDPVDGSDIASLVKDGSSLAWAKICAHCHRDILLTAALARHCEVLGDPARQPAFDLERLF